MSQDLPKFRPVDEDRNGPVRAYPVGLPHALLRGEDTAS